MTIPANPQPTATVSPQDHLPAQSATGDEIGFVRQFDIFFQRPLMTHRDNERQLPIARPDALGDPLFSDPFSPSR
jgi:hypothetical protein